MAEHPTDKSTLLLYEQVKMLYGGIPNSLLANLFGCYIAFFIFSGEVSSLRLLIWIAMLIGVTIVRIVNYRLFLKRQPGPGTIYHWYLHFVTGAGLMALAVGSGGYLLIVFDSISLQVTLALMIVCVASFATTTLSPRAEISIPFLILIFTPILVSLYLIDTEVTRYVCGMMLVLMVLLSMSAYRIYRNIARSIELTIDAESRENELRNSQQRLSLFFKDTPMAVIEWDQEGRVVAWNPAAGKMFQFTEEEAVGKTGFDLIVPIRARQQATETWKLLMTNTGGYHFIEQSSRKDGTTLICEWFNTPLVDNNDKVVGVVTLIQDITLEMENEKIKQEFVSIVSHELRTPVTSIKGSLGLLASGVLKDDAAKTEDMIRIALDNTNRLQMLVNDILDVEKLDSGKVDYHFRNIDLCKLLGDVLQSNAAYAEKYRIPVVLGAMPDQALTRGDPDRLFQVVTNLLSNAVKFSDAGTTVCLSVNVIRNMKFRIMVTNHGKVIPESEKKNLFSKFYQVDSSDKRAKEGSGLGLYICQKILARHGSYLDFSSNAEEGTTFFFDLDRIA